MVHNNFNMCLRNPTNLSFRCGLKESTRSSDVKPQHPHPHPRIESQALRMEPGSWNRLLLCTSQPLLDFVGRLSSHSAARTAWSLLTLAEMEMQSHHFVLRKQSVGGCFGQRDQCFLWGDGNLWMGERCLDGTSYISHFLLQEKQTNAVCDHWPSGTLGTA